MPLSIRSYWIGQHPNPGDAIYIKERETLFKDTDTSREDHMTVEVETGTEMKQLEVSMPTAASNHILC